MSCNDAIAPRSLFLFVYLFRRATVLLLFVLSSLSCVRAYAGVVLLWQIFSERAHDSVFHATRYCVESVENWQSP